jgi:hypothetical protein
VFGNYSTVGGIKETWTAPVYILGANFAEQLPADEDQMPLDGNPHPLPGNLMPQDNFFVLPQYPELGWNNAPLHGHEQQGNPEDVQEEVQDNAMEDQQAEEVQFDDPIVLNPSGLASPQADHGMEVDQPAHYNAIHIGMVRTVFGPVIPPSMQCQQLLDVILPSIFTSFFHKSPKVWSIQASLISNCFWPNVSAMQAFLFPSVKGVSMITKPMKRNRVLSVTYDVSSVEPVELADPLFSVTPPPEIGKKRKARMTKSERVTAIVDTAYRRSTRSCTKRDGHKPVSMSDTVSRPRKKCKIQKKDTGRA